MVQLDTTGCHRTQQEATGDKGTKTKPDITVCIWMQPEINGNNQTQKDAIDCNRTQPDTTKNNQTQLDTQLDLNC